MTEARYTAAQITLHWSSAILVLAIIALPYGGDLFAGLLGGPGEVSPCTSPWACWSWR